MNGTGTQENPYVIMNADDLYSMGTAGSNQTYFSLGADIDFNDTQYAEDFVPILLNCRKFTGNGHVIRNINYAVTDKNACIFTLFSEEEENTPVDVEGIKVENVRLAGKEVFIFGNNGGKFSLSLERCVFVVNDMAPIVSSQATADYRHCILHDNDITASVDYCTFSLNVYFQKITAVFSGDTISHTQLRLEMHTNVYSGSSDQYNSLFSGSSVSDSYGFINVSVYKTGSSGNVTLSSSDSIFNRSYFIIEIANQVSTVYWYGTVGSTCFYNQELLKKNNRYSSLMCSDGSSQFIHGLTTSQCKDAAYLRSIGFNCMEEET
ncbi:MAG: hypothetical protein K2J40_08255 [Ruminococcus sp.]|nr:hypothetical protein [Ruminococcus sp.]